MLLTIVAGLGALGVLVVIHEFGHFLIAKLFGVGVPVFSIGMGPRVLGFHWRGTDYRLSALPVGGYVRMAGADPFGEAMQEEEVPPEQDFMGKPVWQRLLIMLAGPAMNLVLPVVLFTGAYMLGQPRADTSIGVLSFESPAVELGFQEDDRIVAVDGHDVEVWEDVMWWIGAAAEREVPVLVERDGKRREIVLPAGSIYAINGVPDLDRFGMRWSRPSARIGVDFADSPAGRAGLVTGDGILEVDGAEVGDWGALHAALSTGDRHELVVRRQTPEGAAKPFEDIDVTLAADRAWAPPVPDPVGDRFGLQPVGVYVGGVADDSAASAAGLALNDRIFAIDGVVVRDFYHLMSLVRVSMPEPGPDAKARPVTVTRIRDGERADVVLTPKLAEAAVMGRTVYRPLLGIEYYAAAEGPGGMIEKSWSIFEAVPRAVAETGEVVRGTLSVIGGLLTWEVSAKDSLGGPIEIFRVTAAAANSGIFAYARLIGSISVGLAIINLLPVPVLDGGQIIFYAVEGIRGRPLSLALRERLQMVGVLALVALMLFVFVFDINRAFFGG